jgi:segregation and condensation protein B
MEESMILDMGDAVEESVEGREHAEELSTPSPGSEVKVEAGEPDTAAMAAPASDPNLSDLRALKGILEALLFVTADPIPVTRFLALLGAVTKQEVEQALTSLSHDYEQEGRGLQLAEVAGGYRIMTKAEFAPWLKRLEKVKAPSKLSRSALESLAIIAYKQPIVRAEVEQIRGVETSGVIRTLLERKLVRIVGRKEEPGRPIMYGTTKFFLEHFGLRDLSQLPPLREFKELGESEQAMLPVDESVEMEGESLSQPLGAPAHTIGEGLPEEVIASEVNGTALEMKERNAEESDTDAEGSLVVAEVGEET